MNPIEEKFSLPKSPERNFKTRFLDRVKDMSPLEASQFVQNPENEELFVGFCKEVAMPIISHYIFKEEDREDVLQNVYIHFFGHLSSQKINDIHQIDHFFAKLVHNTVIDFLRRGKKYKKNFSLDGLIPNNKENTKNPGSGLNFIDLLQIPSFEAKNISAEVLKILSKEFSKAEDKNMWQVLHLHYVEGYSFEDLAEKFSLKEDTLKARVFRFKAKLQKFLNKNGNSHSEISPVIVLGSKPKHPKSKVNGKMA